jgi:hypothetical protein
VNARTTAKRLKPPQRDNLTTAAAPWNAIGLAVGTCTTVILLKSVVPAWLDPAALGLLPAELGMTPLVAGPEAAALRLGAAACLWPASVAAGTALAGAVDAVSLPLVTVVVAALSIAQVSGTVSVTVFGE